VEIVVVVLVAGVVSALLLSWRRAGPDSARVRAAASAVLAEGGLDPADATLLAAAAGRLSRRMRYDRVGRITGVIVVPVIDSGNFGGLVLGLLGGAALGRFTAQVVEARRAVTGGARVTHLLRPGVADYARPSSVLLVNVVALAPAAMAAVWLAQPTAARAAAGYPASDGIVLASAGIALAALAVAWAAALVVLGLRRVAASPAALTLDDAFRRAVLRDLAVVPLVAGVGSTLVLASALDNVPATAWLGQPTPPIVVALLALAAAATELARPRRRRLPAAA
jgi:hypothetical protein